MAPALETTIAGEHDHDQVTTFHEIMTMGVFYKV